MTSYDPLYELESMHMEAGYNTKRLTYPQHAVSATATSANLAPHPRPIVLAPWLQEFEKVWMDIDDDDDAQQENSVAPVMKAPLVVATVAEVSSPIIEIPDTSRERKNNAGMGMDV